MPAPFLLPGERCAGWRRGRANGRALTSIRYETAATQLSPLLRDYLAGARQVSDEAYAAAHSAAGEAREACRRWIDGVDVILTPSAPDEPPEGFGSTGASTFNRAWTLLGTPALNVPGAKGVNGRPMGLQVMSPPHADGLCLAAGTVLEQALSLRA